MTRKVFFSFHFERDAWRASQVRNSNVTRNDTGYMDAASWEKIKKRGDTAIEKWIKDQLDGTSVTVVLIGAKTNTRKYVKYELEQSWKKGNGILGIYIHKLKDVNGYTDVKGSNTFGTFIKNGDDKLFFHERFKTYDWKDDGGYKNFDRWVEQAAKQAGR